MERVRLQKFLSAAGVCSRRKGEEMISAGRVSVNGRIISELGFKIDPGQDRVEVEGRLITAEDRPIYIALNKPPGVVTSCDQKDEAIVLDLIDIPERVYPVGRLDKDSSGLIILTNDGRLHHRLSHPSFDHEKEYEVTVAAPMPSGALRRMEKGLPMMGTKTRPAEISRISSRRFRIILKEGKNKQIRRMVRKVGNRVTDLKRIRVANIRLGRLAQGAWRYLSGPEKETLLKHIGEPL